MTNRLNGKPAMKLKPDDLRRLREQARIVAEEEKRLSMLRSSLVRLQEQLASRYRMPAGTQVEMATGRLVAPEEVTGG